MIPPSNKEILGCLDFSCFDHLPLLWVECFGSGKADLVRSINPSPTIDEKSILDLCFLIYIGTELGLSDLVASKPTKQQASRSCRVGSK